MRTKFNSTSKFELDISEFIPGSVSSLLIPEKLFEELIEKYGRKNLGFTLRYLITRHRAHFYLGCLKNSESLKIKYQDPGHNLQKVNFRPANADWAELGIIAYSLGVSRCWLFSYLLELEFGGFGEFLELPEIKVVVTTIKNYYPRIILLFKENRDKFERILHFK